MRENLAISDHKSWVLASHNSGKIKEIREILGKYGVVLQSAADFSLPEPEETETSFAGNALLKARAACAATGLPALADDSGLCVKALGGQPGIYSARWAGESQDFSKAMARVQHELDENGTPDRRAAFLCVIALVLPDGTQRTYEGRVDGEIVWPPRGESGFGYDPIFQPVGETRVFAEMNTDEKARFSHRARALDAMIAGELDDA